MVVYHVAGLVEVLGDSTMASVLALMLWASVLALVWVEELAEKLVLSSQMANG